MCHSVTATCVLRNATLASVHHCETIMACNDTRKAANPKAVCSDGKTTRKLRIIHYGSTKL